MATRKRISREVSSLKLLWRTNVTGLSHHDYSMIAKEIEVGDEVFLLPQEGNAFDNEAVAVGYKDEDEQFVQVGWLPAKERAAKGILYKMLQQQIDLRAKVISHDASMALDQRLYIGIYLRVE